MKAEDNIARLQLRGPLERLAAQGVRLEVSDSALDRLAELGYDVAFGARPMRRTIMQQLVNPIAGKLLSGEVKSGDTVEADADESGELRFNIRADAELAT